ncbi:MAG: glycoside hydrolase family 3 C-terminal domain-containing protein [Spirochaetales bacterium]|nr:glycoside hydrolase family 3 C-terminal domain-containing protein [Spirochaetales bacterium]
MNPSPRKRAEILAEKMSLSEKIGQLCQLPANLVNAAEWIETKQPGSFLHITREQTRSLQQQALRTGRGIPLLFGIDAIHGHAFDRDSCVFPSQLAMSCSWDPRLIEEIGRITAREVASTGIHWTFSPVLCIGRDPRWGRTDETFGEDPYVIAEMAKALIRGLQGEDLSAPDTIIACAKHYLAYGETQGGRDSSESDVPMRKLLTLFYPPFAAAANAGCATFMTAYESVDGTPCTARKDLLAGLLKKEPGYNAFIVTDWNNVERMVNEQFVFPDLVSASAAAVESGNDMIMSTPGFYDAAHRAVESGHLSPDAIHRACLEILTVKFRIGLFDRPFPQDEILINDSEKLSFRQKAFDAACAGTVLLKNTGILPLQPYGQKIALIGPAADDFIGQLGDWSFGPEACHSEKVTDMHRNQTVTMLAGLKKVLAGNADLLYERGCHMTNPSDESIAQAVKTAVSSDLVILALGDTIELNGERRDRATLDLPGAQARLAQAVLDNGKPVILVLQSGRPLDISAFTESAAAVLQCWNSGLEGGNALAAILTGSSEPSGKLTISWPRHVGQLPVYYNQIPGWHNDRYADMTASPLFPFGFGLAYTSFSFSGLHCAKNEYSQADCIKGSVRVRNTGDRKGSSVVQIYIRDVVSSVTTPVKSLKWFKKITLKAGEEMMVEFSIPVKDLYLINRQLERVVEPGEFILYAGEDSMSCSELNTSVKII